MLKSANFAKIVNLRKLYKNKTVIFFKSYKLMKYQSHICHIYVCVFVKRGTDSFICKTAFTFIFIFIEWMFCS